MPQLVTIKVHNGQRRRFRLWIPLVPVLLVLSPLVILLVLVFAVACLATRISPVRALGAAWRVLCALRGTRIDIQQGRTAVLISLR